ncbi:serine/threonine-protein phosphatase 6 regulatory ankyrin repeat subunit C-like, partial [Phalaenopsis equestris]|uniref:serine/threonine-protein phosphatase 6 regulatory ankyrin repeat subunit C-like n=1 Tax=Phalaenopsis equestris TaxID=78828 RepID=UPI0009E3B6DC
MDRLVKAGAPEVELKFRPSERCTADFKIESLIHTMPVAVQLTTTRPSLYNFSPAAVALIPPLSSAFFKIVLLPTAAPPIASPPEAIIVRSAIVPALHRADTAALLRFFSRPTLPIFRDASIPIHLIGSHILNHVLLSPNPSSLLSRIIPSCTPDELSAELPLAAGAGDSITVTALLAAGANPNTRNAEKKSPIYLAVSAGKLDSVKALVDAGATDRPFHEAAAGNRTDIIFLMIGKLGPGNKYWADTVDEQGRTAVHAAAENGCVEALHLSLAVGGGDADRADARGWTPLHCAGAGGHLNAAELIIANSSFDPRRALTREGKGK